MTDRRIAPGSSLLGRGDRIVMNIFADPSRVARALGLNIQLPDVSTPRTRPIGRPSTSTAV